MKIIMTMSRILDKCNNWENFCKDKWYSIWIVNEWWWDIEVELTEKDLITYNLINNV